jgi:N-acetylneuraminic acid mutarotase
VVVIGGASDELANASNKVFALHGGSWVKLPSLTHARAGAAAAVVGNTVYCIGGANRPTQEGPVSTIEAVDFS